MNSEKKITCESSDGVPFEVDEAVGIKFKFNRILLSKLKAKILDKLLSYCKQHHLGTDEEKLNAWDAEFVSVDPLELYDLMEAATSLKMYRLVFLLSKAISCLNPQHLNQIEPAGGVGGLCAGGTDVGAVVGVEEKLKILSDTDAKFAKLAAPEEKDMDTEAKFAKSKYDLFAKRLVPISCDKDDEVLIDKEAILAKFAAAEKDISRHIRELTESEDVLEAGPILAALIRLDKERKALCAKLKADLTGVVTISILDKDDDADLHILSKPAKLGIAPRRREATNSAVQVQGKTPGHQARPAKTAAKENFGTAAIPPKSKLARIEDIHSDVLSLITMRTARKDNIALGAASTTMRECLKRCLFQEPQPSARLLRETAWIAMQKAQSFLYDVELGEYSEWSKVSDEEESDEDESDEDESDGDEKKQPAQAEKELKFDELIELAGESAFWSLGMNVSIEEEEEKSHEKDLPDIPAANVTARLALLRERVGRDLVVFETSARDVKTTKAHQAQDGGRRLRSKKATIRVRFPDNHTLEVEFQSSDKVQSLIDILGKVVAHPELPFYIYTTPPKVRVTDFSQDFYEANFFPGAIVYFKYDDNTGRPDNSYSYLREEIKHFKHLSR